MPLAMSAPYLWLIAKAIFCVALLKGFFMDLARSPLWIPLFGIHVWVGWIELLRPGEITGLSGTDVVLPSILHSALGSCAILSIENIKNSCHLGKRRVSKINGVLAVVWLRWLTTGLTPRARWSFFHPLANLWLFFGRSMS